MFRSCILAYISFSHSTFPFIILSKFLKLHACFTLSLSNFDVCHGFYQITITLILLHLFSFHDHDSFYSTCFETFLSDILLFARRNTLFANLTQLTFLPTSITPPLLSMKFFTTSSGYIFNKVNARQNTCLTSRNIAICFDKSSSTCIIYKL